MCLFLRISPEEAAKRGGFGAERYENADLQNRVRALFQGLFGQLSGGDDVKILDAGRGFEEVSEDILGAVTEVIGRLEDIGELRKLGPIRA